MTNLLLVRRLKRAGIRYPRWTIQAARKARLPLAIACALLEQETGGGANVFGHDPTIFVGAGAVTQGTYLRYKAQRGPTGKGGMQGVGPCQLTWYAFQDEADRLGGCWKPLLNMTVGFSHAAALIRRNGRHAGLKAYNGTGEAAEAYADSVERRIAKWTPIVKARAATPKPARKRALVPLWKKLVYGDTDCKVALLRRLGYVARDLGPGWKVYVRFGRRTYTEQVALYQHYVRYGEPLAAKPGTSRHETGDAADVQLVTPAGVKVNIGLYAPAVVAMKRHGLCLPVPGEPWHVEIGTKWEA